MVYMDLEKRGERIGYLTGAGDSIPQALMAVGYQVDVLTEKDLVASNLAPIRRDHHRHPSAQRR